MNTLMIDIGVFQSLDINQKPSVMIIARDNYDEAIIAYDSLQEASEKLSTYEALVERVLEEDCFHGISVTSTPDETGSPYPDLEDCGLYILGFDQLHKAAKE